MSEHVKLIVTVCLCAAVMTIDLESVITLLPGIGWRVVKPVVLQRTAIPICQECETEMHP